MLKRNTFLAASFLLAVSFIKEVKTRTFQTPLPNSLGYYYAEMMNPKMLNDSEDGGSFIATSLSYYNRTASQAYGKNLFGNVYDLSYLFHGKDSFGIEEMFLDAKLPGSGLDDFFDAIDINPEYTLNESGCLVGFAAQRNMDICDKGCRFYIKAQMPIKNIEVRNSKGYDSLDPDIDGIPAFVQNTWVNVDSKNQTFAARLDWLMDNQIVDLSNDDSVDNYVINGKSLQIVSTLPGTNTTLPIQITINDILANKGPVSDGTPDYSLGNLTGTGVLDLNTKTDSMAIPLELYYTDLNKDLVVFDNQSNIYRLGVRPAKIVSDKAAIVVTKIAKITDGTDSGATVALNSTPVIIAAPNALAGSLGNNVANPPVKYDEIPVFVVNSQSLPSILFYQKTMPSHLMTSTDGTYPVYDASTQVSLFKEDTNLSKGLVSTTNAKFNTADATASTIVPSVMHSAFDYSNISNFNLSSVYLVASKDQNGNLTDASRVMYQQILEQSLDDTNQIVQNAIDFSTNFIKGKYLGGAQPSSKIIASNQINWNMFRKQGLGDLDVQVGAGSSWFDYKLFGDLQLGCVFPTSDQVSPCDNYLAVPLGNNGHYEMRVAGQLKYEFCDWMAFNTYGAFSWALDQSENMIIPFKGSTAFGLIPNCENANIRWYQTTWNSDMTFYPNEIYGIDLGYQFFYKWKDKADLCNKSGNNGLGNQAEYDFSILDCYTKRMAHKVKMSLFSYLNDYCQLSAGVSRVVAGKNIPKEQDFFVSLMIDFD